MIDNDIVKNTLMKRNEVFYSDTALNHVKRYLSKWPEYANEVGYEPNVLSIGVEKAGLFQKFANIKGWKLWSSNSPITNDFGKPLYRSSMFIGTDGIIYAQTTVDNTAVLGSVFGSPKIDRYVQLNCNEAATIICKAITRRHTYSIMPDETFISLFRNLYTSWLSGKNAYETSDFGEELRCVIRRYIKL